LNKIVYEDSYHEAAHAVLAKVFEDVFAMEFITLNELQSKAHDPQSKGGLKGKLVKKVEDLTLNDHHSMVMILMAGLCADDIYISGGQLPSDLYETKVWAAKLNAARYSGDLELAVKHLAVIKDKIVVTIQEYTVLYFKVLYKLLTEKPVWDALVILAEHLSKSELKFLSGIQINQILEKNLAFIGWITENKPKLMGEFDEIKANITIKDNI
jgi:hypothetical protein